MFQIVRPTAVCSSILCLFGFILALISLLLLLLFTITAEKSNYFSKVVGEGILST